MTSAYLLKPRRTTQQVMADSADLELTRVEGRVLDVKMDDADECKAAQAIRTARNIVRRYMHPKDREETTG